MLTQLLLANRIRALFYQIIVLMRDMSNNAYSVSRCSIIYNTLRMSSQRSENNIFSMRSSLNIDDSLSANLHMSCHSSKMNNVNTIRQDLLVKNL